MRRRRGIGIRSLCLVVLLPALAALTEGCLLHVDGDPVFSPEQRNAAPVVDSVAPFSVPPGMKVVCPEGPDTLSSARECPVLRWNALTYWAFSHIDNRNAVTLVSYDRRGGIVDQLYLPGARYVWRITVDPAAETVTLWGQANEVVVARWADLLAPPPPPPGRAPECYWLDPGTNRWQLMSGRTKRQCFELDSCDGGLGRSGGGCYKWAISPDAPRDSWDKFLQEPTERSSPGTTLGAGDDGSTVKLASGELLTVILESNPTTGYGWELAEISDPAVLEKVGRDYTPDPALVGLVGLGGRDAWRFAAVQTGAARVRLEYRRPWMKNAEPERTFSVTVVVE